MTAQIAEERLLRLKQRAQEDVKRDGCSSYAAAVVPEEAVDAPTEGVADTALALDRRGSERRVVKGADLVLRRIGGFSFQVGIANVSAGGACVEMIEECEKGEDVIARFPQLEPLGGWVRWTEGTTIGVEFTRPIHAAVFTALVERLTATSTQHR